MTVSKWDAPAFRIRPAAKIEVPKLKSQSLSRVETVPSADSVSSGKSMQKLPDLSLVRMVTVMIFVANNRV